MSSLPFLSLWLLSFSLTLPKHGEIEGRPNCTSNMRQLGLALQQYEQDNDEMMPNISAKVCSNTWRTAIYLYIKAPALYQCPGRDQTDQDANPVGADGYAQSYAANYSGNYGRTKPDHGHGAFAGPGSEPVALATVRDPANLIMLMEASSNPFPQFNMDDAYDYDPASRRFWAGHQGYSNYVLMDGHLEHLRPQDTDREAHQRTVKNLWYRDGTQPLSPNGVADLQDAQERFVP